MSAPLLVTTHAVATAETVALMEGVAFPQYVHWFPESYARVATGLHYPPHRVAQKALTEPVCEALRRALAQPGRSALILAGGNENFVGTKPPRILETSPLDFVYRMRPLALTNVYAARVAQMLGGCDYIATDATACVSATKAIMEAFALVQLHGYDRVVVIAVEDQVNTTMLDFFGETRAVLTAAEMAEDGVRPSAFDPVNRGFFIGQGAAVTLLETAASAAAGGRVPVARVLGASVLAERHDNAIGQREDGAGYRDAMRAALRMAGLEASAIDLIKTHGTGTRSNNQAETAGIEAVFGERFVATGYKQHIGHTMGASSLVETLMAIDDARRGVVRGIRNRTGGDRRFLCEDTPMTVRRLISLSSGMGNVFGALVCDVVSAARD